MWISVSWEAICSFFFQLANQPNIPNILLTKQINNQNFKLLLIFNVFKKHFDSANRFYVITHLTTKYIIFYSILFARNIENMDHKPRNIQHQCIVPKEPFVWFKLTPAVRQKFILFCLWSHHLISAFQKWHVRSRRWIQRITQKMLLCLGLAISHIFASHNKKNKQTHKRIRRDVKHVHTHTQKKNKCPNNPVFLHFIVKKSRAIF